MANYQVHSEHINTDNCTANQEDKGQPLKEDKRKPREGLLVWLFKYRCGQSLASVFVNCCYSKQI